MIPKEQMLTLDYFKGRIEFYFNVEGKRIRKQEGAAQKDVENNVLVNVMVGLPELVEDGILSPEDRAAIIAFYNQMAMRATLSEDVPVETQRGKGRRRWTTNMLNQKSCIKRETISEK